MVLTKKAENLKSLLIEIQEFFQYFKNNKCDKQG